ncbi:MAG: electron transport complex subunit RsxB [Gammaproteobacteria bacterium]
MITLAEKIDAQLPQTQCTRCGYPDCRAYAEAIADGEVDINQCPPGGDETIQALAGLLGREPKPLNPAHGTARNDVVAFIEESLCIGCTKCIQACPVDAIVGAAKQMHTVIAGLCTGCELCIPPCPVDCITLVPTKSSQSEFNWALPAVGHARADALRRRYRTHKARLKHETEKHQLQRQEAQNAVDIIAVRKMEIAAAVERVRRKRLQLEQAKKS